MSLQAFAELNQITDQSLLDTKVQEFNRGVSELWDRLMGLELQLVDQLEVRARNESCHEKPAFCKCKQQMSRVLRKPTFCICENKNGFTPLFSLHR